ncbi:MAG: helix-turn-helix domain-containing protein [Candidatus Micrarchaeia archaeon]|jgi:DNA-binding MarR family transcriptional regulator
MELKLTKAELKVCFKIYDLNKTLSASELAEALNIKKSFLTRILKKLLEKGFIDIIKEGTKKLISQSKEPHSKKLKELYESISESNIEWLSGSALDVLITLQNNNLKFLELEADCSKKQIYNILNKLYSAGAINKTENFYISNQLVLSFVEAYALFMAEKTADIKERIRKHCFVVSKNELPLAETGLSFLLDHGLEAVLINNYYYFNLGKKSRKIDINDAFVHAILFSKYQIQDRTLLAHFYLKNRKKLNIIEIRKYAEQLNLKTELNSTLLILSNYEKLRGI